MSRGWLLGLLVGSAVLLWPARRRPRSWAPCRGQRSVHRAAAKVRLPQSIVLDLVCAALDAGLPTSAAVAAVGAVRGEPLDLRDPELTALARALLLADRTGASAAVVLRRAADDERAERGRRRAVAAGRLGVRLVLPLGLTTLPSFVLLGVAPAVLGLAGRYLGWQ